MKIWLSWLGFLFGLLSRQCLAENPDHDLSRRLLLNRAGPCKYPAGVANGRYYCSHNSNISPGEICDLECNAGYKPSTHLSHIQCLENGTWTQSASCLALECVPPPVVKYGKYYCPDEVSPKPGDVCDLECNSGYRPSSHVSHITCQSTGQWSSTSTCTQIICVLVPSVENGMYYCDNLAPGGVCDLQCDRGFKPNRQISHIECQPDGWWTSASSCEAWDTTVSPTTPTTGKTAATATHTIAETTTHKTATTTTHNTAGTTITHKTTATTIHNTNGTTTRTPMTSSTATTSPSLYCQSCKGSHCGDQLGELVKCPVSTPYCMTHAEVNGAFVTTVTKGCASYDDCNSTWWLGTSNDASCSKTPFPRYASCFFCCTTPSCNAQLIPAQYTLWKP